MPKLPRYNLVPALVLLALLAAGPHAGAATLPRLEADSLGGTHVVLPADAAGKPLVLLLSFTPESQNDVKAWSRAMLADRDASAANVYVVAVADRTSFVSRKHIRGIVEGAAVGTKQQMNDNVLITFSGDGWKTLTPPGDKQTAGVVVCDPNGNVTFAQRVRYSDEALAAVNRALK
jgi:hypothetical protein